MIKYLTVLLFAFFAFSAQAGIIKTTRPGYTATFTNRMALIKIDKINYTGRCTFSEERDGIDNKNNPYHVYFYDCPGGFDLMLKDYVSLYADGIMFYSKRNNNIVIDDMFSKDEMARID